MRIYRPQFLAVLAMSSDQIQAFAMIRNGTFRQYFQPVKNLAAVAHVPEGHRTDHD